MRQLFTWCVAAIVVLFLVNGASSQPASSQHSDVQNAFELLQNEAVQKELDLVEDQIEEIDGLKAPRVVLITSLRDRLEQAASRDERQLLVADFKQSMAEMEKKASAVLMPIQRARLQQLALQRLMPIDDMRAGLHHERVLAELEIDQAQNKSIAEKTSEVHARVKKRVEELTNEIEKVKEDGRREVLTNLTAAQRQKYEKMFGRPFIFAPQR